MAKTFYDEDLYAKGALNCLAYVGIASYQQSW